MFAISIYVLSCNKPRQWVLIIASIVMYAIATSDMVYTVWLLFKVVLGQKELVFLHLYPKYSLFVTNKYVFGSLERKDVLTKFDAN